MAGLRYKKDENGDRIKDENGNDEMELEPGEMEEIMKRIEKGRKASSERKDNFLPPKTNRVDKDKQGTGFSG